MSQQNTPDNDPNQSSYAHGAGGHEPPSNPYYGGSQAEEAPNLDANAPHLRSAEEQRLNRKALLFLGGILILVLAMGFLLLRQGRDEKADVELAPQDARVSTPSLPTVTQIDPTPALPPPQPMPPLPLAPAIEPDRGLSMDRSEVVDRGPTLAERRMGAQPGFVGNGDAQGGGFGPGSTQDEYTRLMIQQMSAQNGQPAPQDGRKRRGPDVEDVANAGYIRAPDALLVRGTYLRCVLETRIITDLSGYTSCLLTEPVYSINGRSLLLPKGSKIYGAYSSGVTGKRVEVIWDRITTPNGIDVAMSSPGVDGLGGAGHPGQYSAHWGSRIASALMISLIADAFKYAAAEHGPETTTVANNGMTIQSPYESATARTMERLANEALSQQRPPTVTINQGTIMNVYVAKDVDFTNVLNPRR